MPYLQVKGTPWYLIIVGKVSVQCLENQLSPLLAVADQSSLVLLLQVFKYFWYYHNMKGRDSRVDWFTGTGLVRTSSCFFLPSAAYLWMLSNFQQGATKTQKNCCWPFSDRWVDMDILMEEVDLLVGGFSSLKSFEASPPCWLLPKQLPLHKELDLAPAS